MSDSIARVCALLMDERRLTITQLEWLMVTEMCNPLSHNKNAVGRKQFQSHAEVETFAKSFLDNLYTDTYYQVLQKLVWCSDKCSNRLGNYVEKYFCLLRVNTIFHNFCTIFCIFPEGVQVTFLTTLVFLKTI